MALNDDAVDVLQRLRSR